MSNSKRIAKNTLLLYVRMLLTMGVSLYTSRIVLNILGVEDYGINSVVGGVIALFSFLKSAMSSATQRFFAFDLGKKDWGKLHKTFNASLVIHIGIAIIIFILAETVGLWFVNNKLNLPPERIDAAKFVYQFSILSSVISITQVPFNALIIAHERMNVFAMFSIFEVILKLIVVYLLYISPFDHLKTYSVLQIILALIISTLYKIYCVRNFKESKFMWFYDKELFRSLISYSGWSLFGNSAAVAKGQGINMVLNIFFGTIVNAAYGIMIQVQTAVNQFVFNFQMAVDPQIIKLYASNDIKKMQKLMFQSAKFSYLLLYFIISPIIFSIHFVLVWWLKNPPKYTDTFIILSLINLIIDRITAPLMKAVQATGKVKWYQIILGTFIFLNLPISYFLLKAYRIPEMAFHVSIVITVFTLIFRAYYMKTFMDFSVMEFTKKVLLRIALFTCCSCAILFFINVKVDTFFIFVSVSIFICILNIALTWLIGLTREERGMMKNLFYEKISKKNA